jgi:predicted amidohydrolase
MALKAAPRPGTSMTHHPLSIGIPERSAILAAALLLLLAGSATAVPAPAELATPSIQRRDRLPRKVLVGTVISGVDIFTMTLEKRLDRMDSLVDEMAAVAKRDYLAKGLDLVILPETFIARPGATVAEQSVRLEDVRPRIAACARLHRCYLVAPVLLLEGHKPRHVSNAAVLVDRGGNVVGIYRKVHPVAPTGSDVLEGGTTPGDSFPVFACDFGRLGIQICFDMLYTDGWKALADEGAEIVALPSASPETVRPASYAREHGYYVVSASPRDHAAFFSPLGLIEAQATRPSVLVHEIDLSYAVIHWEAVLENGEALRRRYGDRVGFNYYDGEDMGIFWSNDPTTTIGQMISSLGLIEVNESIERIRALQDKARGGPPTLPP